MEKNETMRIRMDDGIYSIQKDEEMKRYYNYNISP